MPSTTTRQRLVACLFQRTRERDKQQHFFACLVLVLGTASLGLTAALAITMAIGLGKELWDARFGSGFCWFDMAANLLGAGTGAVITLTIGG